MIYNILIGSLILSVIILITIYYFYNDYEIYYIDYFKVFIVTLCISSISLAFNKKFVIDEYKTDKNADAANVVFGDISDSQQLNGILKVNTDNTNDIENNTIQVLELLNKQNNKDNKDNKVFTDDDESLIQIPKIIKHNI